MPAASKTSSTGNCFPITRRRLTSPEFRTRFAWAITPRPVESMNVTWLRSRITSSASRWAPSRWRTSPASDMSNSPVTVTTCWRRPLVWTIETRTGTGPPYALFGAVAGSRSVAGPVQLVLDLRLGGALRLGHQGHGAHAVVRVADVHQLHALRGATVARDALHRRALDHPALRDEHELEVLA